MNTHLDDEFEALLTEELKDDDFREEYERLGPGFDIARLRMLRGLTQKELAKLVGTRQPSISRLESGDRDPSLSFLRRVVAALDAHIEVTIVPNEELDQVADTARVGASMTIVSFPGVSQWSTAINSISTDSPEDSVRMPDPVFVEAA
jgi:transcriptional regulator with XRE-family HTH domain